MKDLWNCHGSSTDLLRKATDRFADEKITPRTSPMTVFNLQTLSVSVCSRSLADLVVVASFTEIKTGYRGFEMNKIWYFVCLLLAVNQN